VVDHGDCRAGRDDRGRAAGDLLTTTGRRFRGSQRRVRWRARRG
jgi:hypothetical protein